MPAIRPTSTTALILVDLQNWIVGMSWAPRTGDDVVEACLRLRTDFATAGAPVVHVRYLREDGQDGGADAPGNQFVPDLAPAPGEHLVTKHGLDAFQGTDLAARLTALGVTSVLVAGLSTAHGVASTAATALASQYRVVVASDATASVTTHEHSAALDRLRRAGANVTAVAQILA